MRTTRRIHSGPALPALVALLLAAGPGSAQDTVWTRRYNGGQPDDWAGKATVDRYGDLVALDLVSRAGGLDAASVVKYRPNGDTVWSRTQGSDTVVVCGCAVVADSLGNIVIVGNCEVPGGPGVFGAVWKYDRDGTLLWTREFTAGDYAPLYAVALDDSLNIFAAGPCSDGQGGEDVLLLKYSPDGDIRWARYYDFRNNRWQYIGGLALDRDGCIIGTGTTGNSRLTKDCLLVKFTPDGDTVWTRVIDVCPGGEDGCGEVRVDPEGTFITQGWCEPSGGVPEEALAVKFTREGDTVWTRRYSGSHDVCVYDIAVDAAGGALLAGVTVDSLGYYDLSLLLKYSSDGSLEWARTYRIGGHSWAMSVNLAGPTDLYVTGATQDTLALSFDMYVMRLRYSSGVAEPQPPAANRRPPAATIVRGVLRLPAADGCLRPVLIDIAGREVMALQPGANDVRRLAPGVYFLRGPGRADRRVVLTR